MLARTFTSKVLTLDSISPHVKKAEYAVRGDVLIRAAQIEKEISQGKPYPFKELTACNIGNPHFLGQSYLTWIRQGLALATYPELLSSPIASHFPPDIVERISYYLSRIKGGLGAYSESQGLLVARESVSRYIANRDGSEAPDVDNIFLSGGASPAVELTMSCLITGQNDGIMIPIPQYPLYNALITLKQGSSVPYYMDSNQGYWELNIQEMQKSYDQAKGKGINVKSLVVINPGNPTGQVLSLDNMKKIVEFTERNNLVLMADEVYQDNIYIPGKKFHSFRKVAQELNANIELFSYHSLSKGFFGECGLRGGYMELNNIDPNAKSQLLKLASIQLCSTTQGQIALALALDPPNVGSSSHYRFLEEKSQILNSLKRKAMIMYEMLNSMDNIQCDHIEGAMYGMPRVLFSHKALKEAERRGMPADKMYALEAVEKTGIIIVPGSGFGQKPGTSHFRITILSPEDSIRDMLTRFKEFNNDFHRKFKD